MTVDKSSWTRRERHQANKGGGVLSHCLNVTPCLGQPIDLKHGIVAGVRPILGFAVSLLRR